MADFTADLQSLRPPFPFSDIDPSMVALNQFIEVNQGILDNPGVDNIHSFMPFTIDSFFSHQAPEFPGNLAESFAGIFHQNDQNVMPVSVMPVSQPFTTPGNESEFQESKKRKATDVSESSSMNSSPQVSESGSKRRNITRRGKRVKTDEDEKPKEVFHVRARRGQATDSHSLAERVRRGKINERLRCLQDIVPGCYKTMGMAVMLDEIINYVQSLQNQVEFLSMKLTAASTVYDFNAETDAIETMQRAKAQETKEFQRAMREGSGGLAHIHSTWPH